MTNQKIVYRNEDAETLYQLKKGSSQGSPFSPLLWTIMITEVLRKNYPEKTFVQAFADDITIIIKGTQKRNKIKLAKH